MKKFFLTIIGLSLIQSIGLHWNIAKNILTNTTSDYLAFSHVLFLSLLKRTMFLQHVIAIVPR
jgi:hypothetical protein